jgi:hypothetical protein
VLFLAFLQRDDDEKPRSYDRLALQFINPSRSGAGFAPCGQIHPLITRPRGDFFRIAGPTLNGQR